MQYSFRHNVRIATDGNTADIRNFFETLNILLPSSATGSSFTRTTGNTKRIKFSVPRLKKQISFTVESSENFEPVLQTYNLAASLQDCVILFTLSGNILNVQFVTSNLDTFKILKEISTRLEEVNK